MKAAGVWLLLGLALTSSAWADQDGKVVLGEGNTVYQLRNGVYGDLFPDGAAAAAENPVLALDVARAEGTRQRWLVPGTESPESEGSEILVYEAESDQIYVFWQSVVNGIHPTLYFVSFDGAQWDGLIELGGSPFALKESLQVVISRASRSASSTDSGFGALTVLHVFWSEERPGISAKRYAPIFISDEGYLGWTPVYDVTNLITSGAGSPGTEISPGIADAVRAQVGSNRRSCVLGFLDPSTHQLRTYEIELIAPELADFADKIRAEIILVGLFARSHTELASTIAERAIEWGTDFHEAALVYLVEVVRSKVETAEEELTEEGLALLGDKIRAEIILVGMKIGRGGLTESADPQILEISSPGDDGPGQLLKVSSVSDREAPEVGGEAQLWLSESGRDVLVTWEEGERIYYRESVGDGWSEPAFLEVSAELGRGRIYETLAERVRNR